MTPAGLTFAEVLPNMTLTHIGCKGLSVDRESEGPADSVKLDYNFGFAVQADNVLILIRQELIIFAPEQTPFLSMMAAYAVNYSLPNAEAILAENDDLQQQIIRFGQLAAHPYLRASFNDLSNQVGVPGMSLGLLRMGATNPESLTIGNKLFSFGESTIVSDEVLQ